MTTTMTIGSRPMMTVARRGLGARHTPRATASAKGMRLRAVKHQTKVARELRTSRTQARASEEEEEYGERAREEEDGDVLNAGRGGKGDKSIASSRVRGAHGNGKSGGGKSGQANGARVGVAERDGGEEEEKIEARGEEDMDFIESVVVDAREESFALKKKRMELIIEEKEWELETPSTEDEKMVKIVEYVNAVEAFKELCSSQVPNTVSDLLGQYVNVYHLAADAPGYEQALAFLGIDPDEDEDEGEEDAFRSDARGKKTIGASSKYDDDDEDDDEDDEEFEVVIDLSRFGAMHDVSEGLHLAQDIEGNWRWLEDDLGRPLSTKPFGEFQVKLMSIEQMLRCGLNVNSLHEEVDPLELLDFSGCRTWKDTLQVSQEATAALAQMEEDGWKIDTQSWSNDSEHLLVVKELIPLRTMSFVDGTFATEEEEEDQEQQQDEQEEEEDRYL